MALAIPAALKQLLGLPVDAPPTDGSGTPKIFGPAINATDQAAAEASDPTGTSLAIKPQAVPPTNIPAALKKVAAPAENAEAPAPAVPDKLSEVASAAPSKPTAEQLPSLAPQGSSHAVPQAMLELMGMSGPQPKPGETYNGPTTLTDKIKGGIGFAGKIGNALAAAAGTPEQKELAEKRAEFGPTLAANTELRKATLQSLDKYRQGELANVGTRNDINQQKADQTNDKAVATMRSKGYVPDEQNPGTYRSMSADEILADPILSQKQDLAQAASIQKNAQASLAQAHRDAIMNPDNPVFAQKERQIQAQLKMAQAHLALQQHSLANQDANTAMREQEMLYNYGRNSRGEVLDQSNAAPFMAADGQGNPVPNKEATAFRPTGSSRTKGEQAQTIVDSGEQLVNDIKKNADQIGPVASRYNSLQAFLGDPPPEFKGLAAELSSWIALHPAAHGFRGQRAVDEFTKAFGPIEMTPEALIAGIRGSYNTMGALERTATPKTTGPGSGPKKAAPGGTTAPATAVPSFADWKKSQGGQ